MRGYMNQASSLLKNTSKESIASDYILTSDDDDRVRLLPQMDGIL